jgi:parvulin-like peptidyl-prolyl isomerase
VSKAVRFIAALGAVFIALLGLSACGSSSGSIPGNAVANVGGTPITTAAFKHWIGVASVATSSGQLNQVKPVAPEPPAYTACIARLKSIAEVELKAKAVKSVPSESKLKASCETQYKSFTQEVMAFLLSSQWVIGEAQSLGVKLSDAEVKKQFLKIKSEQFPKAAEFEKFIANSGQTVSDLLFRVKLNMLSSKIQTKIAKEKKSVSDAEIEKYYNQHKSQYGTPEKRNANIILTKTAAEAKAAEAELKAGKSWSSVAKKFSIDPTSKATGGAVTGIVKGQEAEALDEELFKAPVNKRGAPIKTAFGYYLYEVTGITASTQQSLSQAKASIKAQLTATKSSELLSNFVKNFKKKWLEKTSCRPQYLVADCKEYKAPKTSSTSTAG